MNCRSFQRTDSGQNEQRVPIKWASPNRVDDHEFQARISPRQRR